MSEGNGRGNLEDFSKNYMSDETKFAIIETRLEHTATLADFQKTQTIIAESENRIQDRIADIKDRISANHTQILIVTISILVALLGVMLMVYLRTNT